jgi:hypothetical protein
MPLSAFTDKAAPPPDDELRATLGAAFPLWESARQRLAALCDRYDEAWGFTSASTGWGLRAKQDGRIIVYLTPRTGEFLASFALGDRALRAARASELPPSVLAVIDNARRYAEGTAVRLTVASEADVDAVLRLAAAKLSPAP